MTTSILVVGGAGYIGSHMVLALREAGYEPLVLDNLSKGHRDAVGDVELVVGDMGDKTLLDKLFSTYSISAVMHFASLIEVGESVKKPLHYYQNNVAATLNLLEVMLKNKVNTFIFSSTAAVYGEPTYVPIDEKHPLNPINPYGRSKYMIEGVLADLAHSAGLHYASLRYFNAAGADPRGRAGERHEPESHLIPIVLQAAAGRREAVTVYGQDYPTTDGTCIRDYVHVTDLCAAHLLALEYLQKNKESLICNLGTGTGYSVQQIIDATRRVTGRDVPVKYGERRNGDPAELVANPTYANKTLDWKPQFTDINLIIQHAWQYSL